MGLAPARVAGHDVARDGSSSIQRRPRELPDPLRLLAVDALVAERAAHAAAARRDEVEPEAEPREDVDPLLLRRRARASSRCSDRRVGSARPSSARGLRLGHDSDEELLQELDLEAEVLAERVPVLVAVGEADRRLDCDEGRARRGEPLQRVRRFFARPSRSGGGSPFTWRPLPFGTYGAM